MKQLFGNLMFFLMLAAMVVGVHAGYLYGKPNYIAWTFKSNAKELERITYNKLASFEKKIVDQMEADSVPINVNDQKDKEKHFKVYQDREGVMHADINWTVHVDYYGFFPKDYNFSVNISR